MPRLKLLITGFGTFPGAPYNPTPALVKRLAKLRRPALADIDIATHVFRVSYAAVDDDLFDLLDDLKPDALLMFGLAARTSYLRIETRARNAVTLLWPDAEHTSVGNRAISGLHDAAAFGPHTTRLLRVAKATGIDARISRDAGAYLCNYLGWRALEACERPGGPLLASFVHVPLTAHDGRPFRGMASRISLDQLVDAGEALLMETVKAARQARLEARRN